LFIYVKGEKKVHEARSVSNATTEKNNDSRGEYSTTWKGSGQGALEDNCRDKQLNNQQIREKQTPKGKTVRWGTLLAAMRKREKKHKKKNTKKKQCG